MAISQQFSRRLDIIYLSGITSTQCNSLLTHTTGNWLAIIYGSKMVWLALMLPISVSIGKLSQTELALSLIITNPSQPNPPGKVEIQLEIDQKSWWIAVSNFYQIYIPGSIPHTGIPYVPMGINTSAPVNGKGDGLPLTNNFCFIWLNNKQNTNY